MLFLGNDLSLKFQRRTLRVLYGQTQATAYSASLDPNFDRTAGALSGGNAISGAKAAILPGMVAVKQAGEQVGVVAHAWATSTYDYRPFGLFANYVGGTMSDIPSTDSNVSVWRGVGSVWELLAPVFDTTNLSTDAAAEDGTAANELYLTSNVKSQLSAAVTGSGPYISPPPTARLVNYLSANAIIIELLV